MSDELEPIESGYESPLDGYDSPEHGSKRDGPVREFTPEHRSKLSDAAKRRHAARRVETGKPASRRAMPDDAEIIEEGGEAYWSWLDESGNERRRKVRRDRGASRVRVRSRSLSSELRAAEELDAEIDRIDRELARYEHWRDVEISYRAYVGVPAHEPVSRGALRNWVRFHRCGGIPLDGICPECFEYIDPQRRKAWRARLGERRVVCKSCDDLLGVLPVRKLDIFLKLLQSMMNARQE